MRTKTYHANSIKDLLVKQKIATMSELQTALGTHVNMTVIRKLQSYPTIAVILIGVNIIRSMK